MSNTHCPACGQRIVQQARRVCADCQKPIGGHHKWFFGADGRARHRVCEQPDAYLKGPIETPPMIEALEDRPIVPEAQTNGRVDKT